MAAIPYHKLRMIVADDFSNFRATVSAMLNNLGVSEVESVATGRDVLQLCQKKRYDVVLCDYDLGRGKNGQQVLEELRHKQLLPRSSLFIIITADTSRSVVMSAYDCEPDDYMMKPITARALEQRLNRLLRQREEMMPVYRALDEKNYPLATTLLAAKASGGSRSSSYSQKLLGELFLQLEQYDQAEQLYGAVLRNRPLDWARLGLARARRAQGDSDAAVQGLTKLIEESPLCLPAYDALAEIWRDRGEKQALQQTLQSAVEISPMSILRQQRLGQIAEENQDLSCAIKAFRRSTRLGQNSCHARPEDAFGLARTVATAKEKGLEQESAATTEALVALNAARERFELSPEQTLKAAVLQGRVHASQGRSEDARNALAEAGDAALKGDDLELSIDLVATLRNLGDKQQADDLLNHLLEKHKNNQRALERLDILLEEPVSDSNRQFVARVNREGITLYEQKRFDEAVERFEQASRLFPNNSGIQLNIAQAMLGKLREHAEDEALAVEFSRTMDHIGNLVDSSHPQFERYNRLRSLASSQRSPSQQSKG